MPAAPDEVSAQLHHDLRHAVQSALATRRPLLHHLNADTSWLLQIPRPDSAVRNGARFYFNILLDPWLRGGQSDLASWFSQQWHVEKSAVGSIAQLEELAREMEILASGLRLGQGRKTNAAIEAASGPDETFIDAVAVSHEFTDHCHKETLLEVHPDVPVFAIHEAARLIQSWHHFRTVITINNFGTEGETDWRGSSVPPLPDWIGISRLLQTDDVLNYHSALMIAFNYQSHQLHKTTPLPPTTPNTRLTRKRHHAPITPNEDEESAEAILYTPHGISSGDLSLIPSASPPIHTLAFLHGLHNVRVSTATGRTALQSNLGAHNGLKAQRILNAKYWIGTHDGVKRGGGLVAWFLQRESLTLGNALEEERRRRRKGREGRGGSAMQGRGGEDLDETVDSFEGVNWVDLQNGESKVLV
ncbi:hypothetical protein KC334_g212 [Hortaea werneckii]|nr:hypothetical protein KC334_g212 [Hortaea werneckii]KAI7027769.1 hypothetical protein KC355_g219 [Hortaea werneckii]RMY32874.1 hypothetical protein D0866_06299 [Hortaea werneckii]